MATRFIDPHASRLCLSSLVDDKAGSNASSANPMYLSSCSSVRSVTGLSQGNVMSSVIIYHYNGQT